MVKGQILQPTIEKYWNFIIKSMVKGQRRLLVKGQSKILAGQDFDHNCRSTYSSWLCDTPLYPLEQPLFSVFIENLFYLLLNNLVYFSFWGLHSNPCYQTLQTSYATIGRVYKLKNWYLQINSQTVIMCMT